MIFFEKTVNSGIDQIRQSAIRFRSFDFQSAMNFRVKIDCCSFGLCLHVKK